jgi:hypothetical protein
MERTATLHPQEGNGAMTTNRPKAVSRRPKAAMLTVAATAALSLAAIPAFASAAPARASAVPPTFMIKGQDLQPWAAPFPSATCPAGDTCYVSKGLLAQAAEDGVTMPPVTYQLCGTWNGATYGYSDYTTCQAGDTLVVENYYKLQQAINDGLFSTLGITHAVYDIESWSFTPAYQQKNPEYWIRRSIDLVRASGLHVGVITSPGGKLARCSGCWSEAAKDDGFIVSIQSQGWGWDNATRSWCVSCWDSQVLAAVKTVRKARKNAHSSTLVMIGLGTDTPRVHKASVLAKEYAYARSIGVNYFWFNANDWQARNYCNASEGGYGCPQIAMRFFHDIGLMPQP